MDIEETMVENEFDNTEAEDSLPEGLVEDAGEPEDDGSEPLTEEEEPTAEEQPEEDAPQGTGEREPGYVKRRIDKAVARAVAETEARMNAKFEAMMAPILEKQMEDEAQELVRSRKVSDIETARELVRLRQGRPAQQARSAQEQPRNSQGQFTAKEDPATSARIGMLKHQADKIRASTGVDVIAEFNKNNDIRNKVISGEMDFYDVAEHMKKSAAKKKPPAPMRSPNGVSGTTPNAIDLMSDEEFDRLNKRIKGGARIRQTW